MTNIVVRKHSAKKIGYFPKDSTERIKKLTLNLLEVLNIVEPCERWQKQIETVQKGNSTKEELQQIFSISFVNWKRRFN